MTIGPLGLLAGAAAMLVLLAAGGLLAVMERDAIRRVEQRCAMLIPTPTDALTVGALDLADRASAGGWRRSVTAMLGYEREKPDQYPLPWWMAASISLAVARGIVWLAENVIGQGAVLLWLPGSCLILRLYFGWASGRRRGIILRQFPDALAMMVRAVRVGIPIQEAVRAVARQAPLPTAPIFVRVSDEMAIGRSLEDALRTPALATGVPEYRFFATAIALQAQTGGVLSTTLDSLSDTISKRVAAAARGRALAAEARASALVLAILPIFAAGIMMVLSPAYMGQLFTTAVGRRILSYAIAGELIGIVVMRTMIGRALS